MTVDRTQVSDWCILRTASSRTLGLAKALAEAQFDVWTPTEAQIRRTGKARDRVEAPIALTPSFVFARFDRHRELVALSRSASLTYQVWDSELRRMVTKGIPQFTMFRHLGEFARIADRALDPLRRIERQRVAKVPGRTFKVGEPVHYPDAGFEGLHGIVEAVEGRFVVVTYPGLPIPVKIDARYLLADRDAA